MKERGAALEDASVRGHCKQLRPPPAGSQFRQMAEEAVREKQTHVRYLEALIDAGGGVGRTGGPGGGAADSRSAAAAGEDAGGVDFSQAPQISATQIRELAEGGYLERAEPVLFPGESDTGKTHLMTGLCVTACRKRKRVWFTTAAGLVNELVEARQWTQVIPNAWLCKALLDRITGRAHIIETGTESYRFRRTRESRQKRRAGG